MQSSQSTIEVSQVLTDALKGRVLDGIIVGVDGAFSIRCTDGTIASLASTVQFTASVTAVTTSEPQPCKDCAPLPQLQPDDYRPKFPGPLQDLLLDAGSSDAPAKEKPPAQTVTISGGINTLGFGMGNSRSMVDWSRVMALPSFQMFAKERSPIAPGGDELKHAMAVIQAASKAMSEQDFYKEYAAWFDHKGYWPNETPLGQIKKV